jgi:hypothetical protein
MLKTRDITITTQPEGKIWGERRYDGVVVLHVSTTGLVTRKHNRVVSWAPKWRDDAWYGDYCCVPPSKIAKIAEAAGLPGERRALYDAVYPIVLAEAKRLDDEDEARINAAQAAAAAVLDAAKPRFAPEAASPVERLWAEIVKLSPEEQAEIRNRLLQAL